MFSFCCSHRKQLEASTYLGANESAELLLKGVELNTLISRLGGTLRGSPRRFH